MVYAVSLFVIELIVLIALNLVPKSVKIPTLPIMGMFSLINQLVTDVACSHSLSWLAMSPLHEDLELRSTCLKALQIKTSFCFETTTVK